MNTKTAREWVLFIVMEVLEQEKRCDTVLHQVFSSTEISSQDKNFIKRASYGVIERAIELDEIINFFSKTKVNKMKPVIRSLLRMGAYELKYMNQVPASATCNELVKIVGKRGMHGLKGFVNGVLRNVARRLEEVPPMSLSGRYSMPQWIIDLFIESYDAEEVEQIIQGLIENKPVTLRIDTEKISVNECIKILEGENLQIGSGNYFEQAVQVNGDYVFTELPSFQAGYYMIQDESSMLPVSCAGILPGNKVIDVCSAPGGKTMQAASLVSETGVVYARDLTQYKTAKMEENCKRMGYQNVKIEMFDGQNVDTTLVDKIDVAIVDVPCSGLGIIGKKPDIKYRISLDKIRELVVLQRKIMTAAAEYVKEGGVFMYSTCTINPMENEENIAWFLENFPYQLESLDTYLPEVLHSETTAKGYLQMIPGKHKSDGFFLARLRHI